LTIFSGESDKLSGKRDEAGGTIHEDFLGQEIIAFARNGSRFANRRALLDVAGVHRQLAAGKSRFSKNDVDWLHQ